jgi:hypothetical protein
MGMGAALALGSAVGPPTHADHDDGCTTYSQV